MPTVNIADILKFIFFCEQKIASHLQKIKEKQKSGENIIKLLIRRGYFYNIANITIVDQMTHCWSK